MIPISSLAASLRYSDHNTQNMLVKKISSLLVTAERLDMEELLDAVVNVNDDKLQAKLFALLSAYLLSKGKYYDMILTCNRLYARVNDALISSLSHKTTTILNFISSLLYNDGDEDNSRRNNLTSYAQNMLRVSGCLTTMSVIFTNTMMYQDTWKALCLALAESCKGCEQNQSLCSHLVPVCIQKLRQSHTDTFTVLLSLVQNHGRNINIFLEANGISIFTRQFLQLDSCLQLLSSIVEQSSEAIQRIRCVDILKNLRVLLQTYGPESQIGQWATVILYRVNVQVKNKSDKMSFVEPNAEKIPLAEVKLLNNAARAFKDESMPLRDNNPDDTDILLSNIVKEINSWQSQSQMNNLRPNPFQQNLLFQNSNVQNTKQIPTKVGGFGNMNPSKEKQRFDSTVKGYGNQEMSFSFINNIKHFSKIRFDSDHNRSMYSIPSNQREIPKISDPRPCQDKSISSNKISNFGHDISMLYDVHNHITYTNDFKPNFMSTPKHEKITSYHNTNSKQKLNGDYSYQKIIKGKRKKNKSKQNLSSVKQVKNRSMGARFFDAINESCTTFVKTFTSIFKPKKDTKDSMRESSSSTQVTTAKTCSNSFTNYMRRRDDILAEGKFIEDESDKESAGSVDACKTCNDTLILKNKLVNDKHLKNTLKKLKLGINLYGCDFKKISRNLWPREKYMSPTVLYHLYRKLIVKH